MKAWSFLTLWSGLLALWIFSAVPQYFEYAEHAYRLPCSLRGQFVIRNDAMGKGIFGAHRSGGRRHNGIDITSVVGDPVTAAKSGRVVFVGVQRGYGNYIRVEHPDGMNTRYAHLTTMRVHPGQWVWRGQLIGTIGKTGNADHPTIIPHLHFEIRNQEEPIDPMYRLDTSAPNFAAGTAQGNGNWEG
jgi:murein DD-endopeptidase MepM/ murein hydrolase activator NlpD